MKRTKPRLWATALVLLVAITAAACSHKKPTAGSAKPGTVTQTPIDDTTKDRDFRGPWTGQHWPPQVLPAGVMLHDSGDLLETIRPDGTRTEVWKHPHVDVTELAVSGDRRQIAAIIALPDSGKTGIVDALYVLDAQGEVNQVDIGKLPQNLTSPIFLRRPSDQAQGPERLYWIRQGNPYDPEMRKAQATVSVRDTDGSVKAVTVPLRDQEFPGAISAWPGSRTFTLNVLFHVAEPSGGEILGSDDYLGFTRVASFERWSAFGHRAFTDSSLRTVWLNPVSYVVPLVDGHASQQFSLQRFEVGCEGVMTPPVIRVDGTVDDGIGDTSWTPLRLDDDHLLVLSKELASRAAQDPTATGSFLRLDALTGEVQPSKVAWSRGAWTAVPDDRAFESGLTVEKCKSAQ